MANIFVSHSGSQTAPYDTEAKATRSIATAIGAASAGDTVYIKADATYTMNGTDQQLTAFNVTIENLKIKGYYLTPGDMDAGGAYYQDSTHGWAVIDGVTQMASVFSMIEKSGNQFHNLKLINFMSGIDSQGNEETKDFNLVVSNCRFDTNEDYGVHAGFLNSVVITDCVFSGYNNAGANLLLVNCSGVIISNCKFLSTHAEAALIYIEAGAGLFTITDNVFYSPTLDVPAVHLYSGSMIAMIEHNTIAGGSKGIYIQAECTGIGTTIFRNIITGCATGIDDDLGILFGGDNCFYGNTADWTLRTGDIIANPQFQNTTDFVPKSAQLWTTKGYIGAVRPSIEIGHRGRYNNQH